MAEQQQLKLLWQGVQDWNIWRRQHPEIHLDLSEADLSRAELNRADLSKADLSRAVLIRTNLSDVDLSDANLSDANLRGADLSDANLRGANLSDANLRGASLSGTSLSGTDLSGTDLSGAFVGQTIFGNIDLRTVKGLENMLHVGPSTIGTDTLLRSEGDIPETFLRGAGLTDTFITYVRSLAQNPIEYYTCFISVRLVSPKHAQAWGWAGKEYSFYN